MVGLFRTFLAISAVLCHLVAQGEPAKPVDPWARDYEVVLSDEQARPVLRVKLEFLGHRPPAGYSAFRGDPDVIQHDFYRRTLTNMSGQPVRFTTMSLTTRYGATAVQTAGGEVYGAVVKVDLERNPLVPGNELAPGQSQASHRFMAAGGQPRQALDILLGVEQGGRKYEVLHHLVFQRDADFRK
jgi:hypothetical protein